MLSPMVRLKLFGLGFGGGIRVTRPGTCMDQETDFPHQYSTIETKAFA